MSLPSIIALVGLVTFLVIKIRKVILRDRPEDKEDGAKGGEPKGTFITRLNFLQKWNFKKTVTWIFVFLLAWQAFAMIFPFHPSPYDLIVAIRHRNDPSITTKPESAAILPVTEALLKSAMMFCEKSDGKRWVLRAEIKQLSEHQLVIYYLYSDENCGKSSTEVGVIKCLRPEKSRGYVGVWRDDSRGTAEEIELQANYANGEICCFAGRTKESRDDVEIKIEIKTNPAHSHSSVAKNQ